VDAAAEDSGAQRAAAVAVAVEDSEIQAYVAEDAANQV
jgi:hypothetical protein